MENGFKINPLLVQKYTQPVSGYNCYPAPPFWNNWISAEEWSEIFQKDFININPVEGISIYIHLPFCEALYGSRDCDIEFKANHTIEDEYLLAIAKEWKLYRGLMHQTPVIREIHLGGGFATNFSSRNLYRLLSFILKNSIVHPAHEFSVESHPESTTHEHLEMLYALGFRRISFDVQDNENDVQQTANRIQPFEMVKKAVETARETGFTSINFGLVSGRSGQIIESIEKTIEQLIKVKPERFTILNYENFSSTRNDQRLYHENLVPDEITTISQYLKSREMLMRQGYHDIGMDHFVLSNDNLYLSWQKGKLHRNLMGYTTLNTGLILGLGVSSNSDTGSTFAQNIINLSDYHTSINNNQPAIRKAYILNEEDKLFRKNILEISTRGKTSFSEKQTSLLEQFTFPALALFESDNLLWYDKEGLEVTPQGHFFIRQICNAFDIHLHRNKAIAAKSFFL